MVIISIFALSFSEVWNNSYNDIMLDPFWKNGNILLVLIYTVLYIFIANSFGAFHLGYYTELSLIGSQLLGMLSTNVIAYVIISLIGRGRLSPKPMLRLTLYELFILILWVYVFSILFAKLYRVEIAKAKSAFFVYGQIIVQHISPLENSFPSRQNSTKGSL